MPAQPKGDAAKTEAVTVRMTRSEKHALIRAFGNERAGLRALLNEWKAKGARA